MCGGSGTTGGRSSASSSFGGYSFGSGLGSIASQRRGENRSALGRGSNISNLAGRRTGGQTGAKQSLGAPEPAAAKAQPVVDRKPVPTAPLAAFTALQEDIEEGKTVNAADYSRLGLQAMDLGKMFNTAKNMREAQKVDGDLGKFVQPEAATKSLSWSTLQFEPNRDMAGSLLDAITGRNRTYSMQEAAKDVEKGMWGDRAKSLSFGNTKVNDRGIAEEDQFGKALDVLSPITSLARMALTGPSITGIIGTAKGLYDLKRNSDITDSLYGKGQRTAGSGAATRGPVVADATAAMLGEDGKGGKPFGDLKAKAERAAAQAEARRTAQARTARPLELRTRQSLILTGPTGIHGQPDTFFRKLFGA